MASKAEDPRPLGALVEGLRPELALGLRDIPDYQPGDVGAARSLMAEAMGGALPVPAQVITVDGHDAPGGITVRVHTPAAKGNGGALVHIHGGGFFMGSAKLYDGVCAELADLTGCTVFAVDYRLAPEYPFPAGLEDCVSAWGRVLEVARDFAIDSERLGIYGESAGAALAIGLVHRLQHSEVGKPAILVVQEPVLDDRLEGPSARQYTATPVWNRGLAEWSWSLYLGHADADSSPEAAPARLAGYAGFPPTLVSTRDFDPLRDEGIAFARRLIDDGVRVDLRHYSGTYHGVLGTPGTVIRERILRDSAEFIVDHLSQA